MNTSISLVKILLIVSALAFVALGGANLYLYYYKKPAAQQTLKPNTIPAGSVIQAPSKTGPSPTPIPYKIPGGLQTYRFSNGSEMKGPKIQSATIDPLDPANGAKQTITLEIESDSPVTSTEIIVTTDKKKKNIDLKLTDGDPQKGTYQGSWQINDSYLTMYAFRFIIKSANGTYDNVMRIR